MPRIWLGLGIFVLSGLLIVGSADAEQSWSHEVWTVTQKTVQGQEDNRIFHFAPTGGDGYHCIRW